MSGGHIFVGVVGDDTIGEYNLDGSTVNAALVSGLNGPLGLAVSGGHIFVANYGSGTIGEYNLDGSTVNASLVSGLDGPYSLAVAGGHIFVVNNGSGTIGEYNLDGSTVNASLVSGLNSPTIIDVETVAGQPSITNQPASVTNNLGDNLVLSIGANGSNSMDFQWYFSGTNIDTGSNSTLVISNIQQAYFGNYYVVVSNAFGSVTSSVATIFEPATILVQPTNAVVPAHSPATFSVTAAGYPSPSFQWALNQTNILGATSNMLTISTVVISNTGNYQVTVSNSVSSTLSAVATLNMAPSITAPFLGATPIWGQSATLMVAAIGSGTLSYQWYFNGQPIPGANDPQLDFSSIQFTNNGFYSVVISSPYGSVSNVAEQVSVNPADVTLEFSPTLNINAAAGDSYLIQRSADLSNTNNWITLTPLTLTQPQQKWVDTSVDASSPFNNRYFYRLVPQQ